MSTQYNDWAIRELTGYEPKTTFWQDFSIADAFGLEGIQDTYNRAFAEWKTDYIYLTELVMVLNWKVWYWYEQHNMQFYDLYLKLYEQAEAYACNNLKGEEAEYYFRTTD